MGREWEPGDVALVRQSGHDRVAMRDSSGQWTDIYETAWDDSEVDKFGRPLVVIDPEDREQVNRLADAFCSARWSHMPDSDECDPLTRSAMRDAVAAMLSNPTPTEPTNPFAVVLDSDGHRWVRNEFDRWYLIGARTSGDWSDIDAVRVLSEGVAP